MNRSPKDAADIAENNFKSGMTCAQSVVSVFAQDLNLSEEDLNIVKKIAEPFGGGMCRTREVCGTVSGMLMALGLMESSGKTGDVESKNNVYKIGQNLMEEFRKSNGSVVCRELLGLVPMGETLHATENGKAINHVIQEPKAQERTPEYYKKRPCPALCGDAARIFQEWLNSK